MVGSMRLSLLAATCLFAVSSSLVQPNDVRVLNSLTWQAVHWLEPQDLNDGLHRFDLSLPIHDEQTRISVEQIKRTNQELADVKAADGDKNAILQIKKLNKLLAETLNVPMKEIDLSGPWARCNNVRATYRDHMTSTTKLLAHLMERKPNPFTSSNDPDWDRVVLAEITWMQALWASRTAKGNEQNLSFIEQRQTLYKATGCFDNTKEILRRDVEIVESLNDVIDAYTPRGDDRRELK